MSDLGHPRQKALMCPRVQGYRCWGRRYKGKVGTKRKKSKRSEEVQVGRTQEEKGSADKREEEARRVVKRKGREVRGGGKKCRKGKTMEGRNRETGKEKERKKC